MLSFLTVLEHNLNENLVRPRNTMGTPIDYIYENELQWQPSFNGALDIADRFGYRGELVVTAGKQPLPDKQMPPKVLLKHAICVSDKDAMLLFAGQLGDFNDFEATFERFKSVLTPTTITTLFVDNLISDSVFEYEGVTVYAFALDESSVWNELVSHADLDKKELKRMSAEDKLDVLYDGLKVSTLYASKMSYEETCALRMGN